MASTALKTEEEKKEYFDTPEVLDAKIEKLAEMIRASTYFCAFTGAGISTASGIPDYRSGADTKLKTGAGCWENAANIQKARQAGTLVNAPAKKNEFCVKISKAYPSKCHMALVEMMNQGILKHVISQNIDGLHRKSGIPADKISELHGNTNLEICKSCNRDYMRDFRVRTANKTHDHKTGRKCEACGGDLYDSIINFGEPLIPSILNRAYAEGEKCDVMLSLGSSLRVTPACNIPADTGLNPNQKHVIVNL